MPDRGIALVTGSPCPGQGSVDRAAESTDGAATPAARSVLHRGSVFGWVSLGFGTVAAGLLAARAVGVVPTGCALRTALGVPCPACGLTHALLDVVHGNLGVLFTRDPAAALLMAVLVAGIVAQLVAMVRPGAGVDARTTRVLWVAAIALGVTHWVTTMITGGLTV